jgi:uroporphyrinogen decarboxylase
MGWNTNAGVVQIISEDKRQDEPIIVFCKDCGHSLEAIADTGCDVVGLDWTVDIGDVRKRIGNKVALQGNMDPLKLYGTAESIRTEVKSILNKFGKGTGHVFNLGHGILPDVPVENAKAFVRAVKEESIAFHK